MKYNIKGISKETLLHLYVQMLKPRMIEEKLLLLLRKGKISKWFAGIGQEAVFPNLTDLQVVNLEEPYYYMNVDGDRLYLDSAKHLTNQALFQEECVKQLRFNPPTLFFDINPRVKTIF